MLITVVGSSGLGRVAGVPSGSPAALLRVVADRPDQQVVVLAPESSTSTAQRQADLVAAARPSAQVSVLTSSHHALTLTVVADRILESAPWLTATDHVLDLVRAELTTARSLIWSPSAWRLRGVDLSPGARLRCLMSGRTRVLELGPGATVAHDGWRPDAGERIHTAGRPPAELAAQLDDCQHRVDTEIETGPYPSSAVLLTALAAAPARPLNHPDPGSSAGLDQPIDPSLSSVVTRESEAA